MHSGAPRRSLGPLGFAFVMFSMAACLPLFFLGPIAYNMGLSLGEALLAALLGNLVVAVAMALNGYPGVAERIDFPEQARRVFGALGAKVVVALRGLVGALWFGVEAYNGALALIMILLIALGFAGDELLARAMLLLPAALVVYLAAMLAVLWIGVEGIGLAASVAGPLLLLYFAWLAWWLHTSGSAASAEAPEGVGLLSLPFLVYLAIQTNWWATVAVNMSDLSRLARDWRSVWIGVLLGMVGGQLLGTYLSYQLILMTGKSLPHEIIAGYAPGVVAILVGLLFAFLAPWTTDITANVPALIDVLKSVLGLSWRRASLAAVLLGFVLAPWWALDAAQQIVDYVTAFAASYGVILGPILGPMIAAVWIVKARDNPGHASIKLDAMAAFLLGVAASYAASIAMGGVQAVQLGPLTVPFPSGPTWYVGVAVSLAAYLALRGLSGKR